MLYFVLKVALIKINCSHSHNSTVADTRSSRANRHPTVTSFVLLYGYAFAFLYNYVTSHGETRKKVAEPQSKIQQIFNQWGVIRFLFVTDYSSRMFISQVPANKITEIDLEVCEKAKFRAPFCGC